jgi:HD-GYP domain-containing protein (c-di-GMP phosphodiesterase class II)
LQGKNHLSYFYDTEEEYKSLLSSLLSNLKSNEKAIFLSEKFPKNRLLTPEEVVNLMKEELDLAIIEGYESYYFIINPISLENILEYEAEINQFLIGNGRCYVACYFNINRLDKFSIIEILQSHPMANFKGKSYESDYYIPSDKMKGENSNRIILEHYIDLIREKEILSKKVGKSLLLEKVLRMLIECNQMIVRANDEDELINNILKSLVKTGGYSKAKIGIVKDREYLWREETSKEEYKSYLSFTLKFQEEVIGVLEVYTLESSGFTEEEKKIFSDLADDISFSITSLRLQKLQREMELALRISEERYRTIFENAPVALMEEDFSGIKTYIDSLIEQGINDLEAYLDNHLEEVLEHLKAIRIIDMNDTAVKLYGANSKEDLDILDKVIKGESSNIGKKLFLDISQGDKIFENENINYTLTGERKIVYVRSFICPGYEETLSNVITAVVDVTRYRNLETELKESIERVKRTFSQTIDVLSYVIEAKDPYTVGHQKRVAKLACRIAEEMGLDRERIDDIRIASMLHDIGKIVIPGDILNKPWKLTQVEFEFIKVHPKSGYDILKNMELFSFIALIVLQHHERLDGSGYPQGLKDDEILLEAKILAVADVVEAMTSHRPYRSALSIDTALEEIIKNKGRLYEEKVVETCIKLFKEKGFNFEDG